MFNKNYTGKTFTTPLLAGVAGVALLAGGGLLAQQPEAPEATGDGCPMMRMMAGDHGGMMEGCMERCAAMMQEKAAGPAAALQQAEELGLSADQVEALETARDQLEQARQAAADQVRSAHETLEGARQEALSRTREALTEDQLSRLAALDEGRSHAMCGGGQGMMSMMGCMSGGDADRRCDMEACPMRGA